MTSIALVVPADVTTVASGGNLYDLRVAGALRRNGHEVTVVPVPGSWPAAGAEAAQVFTDALNRLGTAGPDGEGAPAVVIDGLIGAACPDTVAAAAAAGMRLFILLHLPLALECGLDAATAARRNRRERAALHAATGVIATSDWAAQDIVRRHGLHRVAVALPGTEPAAPASGSDPPLLLQVGALTPRKDQLSLVHALTPLAGMSWTARLVGSCTRDAEYAALVRRAVRDAGLEKRIRFTGELTGAALAGQWRAADLSVLPSRAETYGMVVTESLARGVPVIVSTGTGAEESLGRDDCGQIPGFAVPPGNPAELGKVLTRWLREPALRSTVRVAAEHRRARLTGWDHTAQCLAAAIQ